MPVRHARELRIKAGRGQRMIEITGLTVEDVGIAIAGRHVRRDLIDQAAGLQRVDRIFRPIGVQIADDDDIGIGRLQRAR